MSSLYLSRYPSVRSVCSSTEEKIHFSSSLFFIIRRCLLTSMLRQKDEDERIIFTSLLLAALRDKAHTRYNSHINLEMEERDSCDSDAEEMPFFLVFSSFFLNGHICRSEENRKGENLSEGSHFQSN